MRRSFHAPVAIWQHWQLWLLVATLGCGHGVANAWQSFGTGEIQGACGDQTPCKLVVHDTHHGASRGGGKVAVLQLPNQTPWQVHADDPGHDAVAWQQRLDAAVVFNAGFYAADKAHVGWLRRAGIWQQPRRQPDWHGLVVSQPANAWPGAPTTDLVDLQQQSAAADANTYAEVVQSMVLLDRHHAFRCRNSNNAASRTVVARDQDGSLYVVVTQGAWRLAALADWLLVLLPQLQCAINLDGGHEAQLVVATDAGVLSFAGEHGSHLGGVLGFGRGRRLPFVWTVAAAAKGAAP